MRTRVIYLYRTFPEKMGTLSRESLDGVYLRNGSTLVGIDKNTINNVSRRQIEKDYSLREFEVDQDKFGLLIKELPRLGAQLTNVEISRMYIDYELNEELTEAIQRRDIESILEVIHKYWGLGTDVESIEFYWQDQRIKFTRLAELDLSSQTNDISDVLNTLPIGILAGVVRDGELE